MLRAQQAKADSELQSTIAKWQSKLEETVSAWTEKSVKWSEGTCCRLLPLPWSVVC